MMPHLRYDATELDREFPALEAPPDDGLEDLAKDERDSVFQHGLGIARAIQAEADEDGRRRRPRSDPAQALQLVESFDADESEDEYDCEEKFPTTTDGPEGARKLHDEAKPDCPSEGISVNRVRARFARCAQFPTRRTPLRTDLPGSECAYARWLFDEEYADAGAVECSSELSVQSFQVHETGSRALPSTQAITVGRARGSGDLC